MKIEIELEYIESLKRQLDDAKMEANGLREKLNSLNEKELREEAVRLSFRLFEDYLHATFTHLGFDQEGVSSVVVRENLEHWLGKSWYRSERVTFQLGATITTKMRKAFLQIGILMKETEQ